MRLMCSLIGFVLTAIGRILSVSNDLLVHCIISLMALSLHLDFPFDLTHNVRKVHWVDHLLIGICVCYS